MRLFEFQGKDIFSEYNIPTPQRTLINKEEDLKDLVYPVMLKAQTLVGGRGKAGGIRKGNNIDEASNILKDLFALKIKGKRINGILAEECIPIDRELYLAITIDKQMNKPIMVASPVGGIDIEEVAKETPEKVFRKHIDPFLGIQDFMIRKIAKNINIQHVNIFLEIVKNTFTVFKKKDSNLVEINPLAVSGDRLVALDAKIILDDKARYRHPDLFNRLEREQQQMGLQMRTKPEDLADKYGMTYIPLSGDIAVISDGAGTGMLTLDILKDEGAMPSCLCEMGGITNSETMFQCLKIVTANPDTKKVLVILIGGLNRMDEMAEGILNFVKSKGFSLPMAIRICGTNEEIGIAMLNKSGIKTYDDLYETVNACIKAAGVMR